MRFADWSTEEMMDEIDVSSTSLVGMGKYPIIVGVLPSTMDYCIFDEEPDYPSSISPNSVGFVHKKDALLYIAYLKKVGYGERCYYF